MVLEQLVGLDPLQGKTSEEDEDQTVLQRPLEISLKYSTVSVPDGSECPLVKPQPGVEALHAYAEWITELVEKEGGSERECYSLGKAPPPTVLLLTPCSSAALLGHWAEVWTLCEALWGRLGPADLEPDAETPSQYEQQLARRRSFSAWLSSGATHRVEEEVSVAGKGCHIEAIFSYLTGNRISEACRLAQKEGEFSSRDVPKY